MKTGKHREHEDIQVDDINVFYNVNLIVAGFFLQILSPYPNALISLFQLL